jgi:hypothetical protein
LMVLENSNDDLILGLHHVVTPPIFTGSELGHN